MEISTDELPKKEDMQHTLEGRRSRIEENLAFIKGKVPELIETLEEIKERMNRITREKDDENAVEETLH